MKILVSCKTSIHKLLDIERGDDGSVYISLDRKPRDPRSRQVKIPGENLFVSGSPVTNARKLSYHTTGRVNYHGLVTTTPNFFEPLVEVTQLNHVLVISIPSIERLDIYTGDLGTTSGDICMPVENTERFAIGITFAPASFKEQNIPVVRCDFEGFALLVHPTTLELEPPSSEHFVYAAPPSMFPSQRIGNHAAELAYVQGEGRSEIVIYGPNGNGEYTMFFAVVMRVKPKVTVKLYNPKFRFELLGNDNPHKLRFRIHGKGDLVREENLRPIIKSIELDAEL